LEDNGCSASWEGPNGFTSTEASLSGLEEGDYTVTVTSTDGCSSSETVTISDDSVIDECGVCGGDNSSCFGCMNSAASNYNETATTEDGSCLYDQSYVDSVDFSDDSGCMDSTACNYDETATTDDDSCEFTSCLDLCGVLNGDNSTCTGCTYEFAEEYDPTAIIDDGSCSENIACPGDFSGDGFINVSDLGGFLGAFGESCE
jgi:hypothetical protein